MAIQDDEKWYWKFDNNKQVLDQEKRKVRKKEH
jgi:hypothetical protein